MLEEIHLLENKLMKLLSNYEFLQKENKALLQINSELQVQIKNKEQKIVKQEQEIALLKVAKTIQGSNRDVKETKLKINTLIREVDKCIILLRNQENEQV